MGEELGCCQDRVQSSPRAHPERSVTTANCSGVSQARNCRFRVRAPQLTGSCVRLGDLLASLPTLGRLWKDNASGALLGGFAEPGD